MDKNFKEIQHVISEYFGYDVSEDSFNPVSMIVSYGKQGEVTNYLAQQFSYSNEKDFKYSNLYKMMNRILGWDGISKEKPVEKYFNFRLPYPVNRPLSASRLRPRDIVVMLRLIQQECKKRHLVNPNVQVMDSTELITKYSNYYIDQIKRFV